MGDLYRDDPVEARSAPGVRQSSAFHFHEASPPPDLPALPLEFVDECSRLDRSQPLRPRPSRSVSSFRFREEDESRFFTPPTLSNESFAFGSSLRASNPLRGRDFKTQDAPWSFCSEASCYAAKLAVYSAALSDFIVRADDLGVSGEDRSLIRFLLLGFAALSYSQALRVSLYLFATKQRRALAVSALRLRGQFCSSAVDSIPRSGPYVFGGRILDADISMGR